MSLEQFLDPTDPLHAVVLKQENIEQAFPLLVIDSLSLRQRATKPSVIDAA